MSLYLAAIGILTAAWIAYRTCLSLTRYDELPLIGHAPWVLFLSRQQLLEWIAKVTRYHDGRTWKLVVPTLGRAWVTEDPACVKHVLATRHEAFAKGDFAGTRMRDLFGDGIVTATGSKWKSQRLAGHQAFTRPANLSFFAERILPKHLRILIDGFEAVCQDDGKDGTVDVQEQAERFAMALFGEMAYDSNFSHISSSFSQPFTRASIITDSRFANPLYRLTERLTPSGRRFAADVREVKRFGRELVLEMKEKLEKEEEGNVDEEQSERGLLLKELIKAHGGDGKDTAFLADACLNFLTAGKDTTAQALAWSIYRLLLHPEHIPFLRQEIDAQSTAHPIPYQALTSPTGPFRHVNSFISEVLRLHPPVPMEILQNVSHESVVLPDQARTIVRPLELVIWCPHNMGRSSRIWGEDATTFRPGRWLEDDKNGTSTKHPLQKTAYEFPVFHGGPRSCLGKPLARAELAFSLVELLRRYDLEPAWDVTEEKRMGSGLLAPVRGGLPVRVRRRR